jgi:hypothetical protein
MMIGNEYFWPDRLHEPPHISTREYARLVRDWVISIGLQAGGYGMHSMLQTKVGQIYRKTGILRAAQLLLGDTNMDSTVRYLTATMSGVMKVSMAGARKERGGL